MGNELIGKKIVDVKIAEDNLAMLFVCESGDELVVRVDADCCSYTWIESVELPALGFPFTVIACDDLDINKEPLENEEYEYLQFYGAKITTDKGDMVIDYRNDSNGYYGGNIVWPGEDFYGGVYGQNETNMNWRDIEE